MSKTQRESDPIFGGVIDFNKMSDSFYDELNSGREIDLGWSEHIRFNKECKTGECMCDVGGRVLVGSWKQAYEWRSRSGKACHKDFPGAKRHRIYVPTEEPGTCALIFNRDEATVQVSWSEHVQVSAQMCSLCYRNQVNLGSMWGGSLGYMPPPSYILNSYRERRFRKLFVMDGVTYWEPLEEECDADKE